MSSYPAPGQSWPPQGGDQGHDPIVTPEDRNWVVAAHLGSFLTAWFTLGLVAPLVVLLLKGGSSPFVRRHAVESLNFQINAFVWSIVFVILAVALIGIPLLLAVRRLLRDLRRGRDRAGVRRPGVPLPAHVPDRVVAATAPAGDDPAPLIGTGPCGGAGQCLTPRLP